MSRASSATREACEVLKTVVFPKLTVDRSRHEPVRIWALGCSTGEEAYSLAMTFTEYAEQAGRTVDAQIFATDLNGTGIEKACTGVYAKGITQDISPERLRRFFVDIDGTDRITKKIRDICVFARQNVLADPPFSRAGLIYPKLIILCKGSGSGGRACAVSSCSSIRAVPASVECRRTLA
jgi:two-component system CheB/CheR fusion protein